MDIKARLSRGAAPAAALDPVRLCSGSILIYCRSSVILSVLIYGALVAKIYSDLYAHLIRQTARALAWTNVPPGAFFAALLACALFLAFRMRPRLEKAALLILAANLGVFLLRRKAEVHSDTYLALCAFSLLLDLGLLATVVAFYRKYPNVLRILRSPELSPDDRRLRRAG